MSVMDILRPYLDRPTDTHQDFDELVEQASQLADPPLKPHPDMRRAIPGRRIVNDIDFYRRYPQDFHGTVLIDLPDQGPLDKAWSALGRLWRH